ncbi:dentin sialophosphoprotein, putative (DUF1296) isoform X2 [Wolffia australiana]
MVGGSRGDLGVPQYKLSSKLQTTINSVREIVGAHSEAEILAVLRETNMDPNETVQRLLYQDPFHEVKRRRDKKKQNPSAKDPKQPQVLVDHSLPSARTYKPVNRSARVGRLWRNRSPGAGREFRIVRDNRENQNVNTDHNPENPHRSSLGDDRSGPSFRIKSSSRDQDSTNYPPAKTENRSFSEEVNASLKDGDDVEVADAGSSQRQSTPEAGTSSARSLPQGRKGVGSGLRSSSEILAVTSSSSGVYASSSDPVHVPSPDSRSAGIVGAIRREVGVVGGRRHLSDRLVAHSFSLPSGDSVGHSTVGLPSQPPSSESVIPANKPFSSHQYHSKMHSQSNMEWRPKSSQKSVNAVEQGSSTAADDSSHVEAAAPPDAPSDVKISDSKHVIIPQHLRVPEADRVGLTFGSFGSTFDSVKPYTAPEVASPIEPSASSPISGEDRSFVERADAMDGQCRTSQAESPEEAEASSPDDRVNYADIGLVQTQTSSYPNPPLPSFSEAYDPQHSYDAHFFSSGLEDGIHGPRLSSPAEVVGSSGLAMMQQQAMLYPQMHLTHYPNFVPYRQILSPMYVPPMAMPSYSSGSGYVLMPGAKYKPLYTSDDVSRVKFKDGGPYMAAPQVEGPEIWVQPQREMPGFYNVPGQAAYSHVQFPGVYHQAAMAGPHHLAAPPTGVAAQTGPVGSYQQPQVSHLGWNGGF